MSVLIKDWKSMPEGKEKYHHYLASREWGLLKHAVHKRSGGTCERCRCNTGEQVHHLTYERKYREELDDLIHICVPCHQYTHGIPGSKDPAMQRPVKFLRQTVKTVYLAGKITGDNWRDEILPAWSGIGGLTETEFYVDGSWNMYPAKIPDGRHVFISGPYWVRLPDSGVHAAAQNEGEHASGEPCGHGCWDTSRVSVARNAFHAIKHSDLVFAWINSTDCYGTLVEIGLAIGMGKPVIVCTLKHEDECECNMCNQGHNLEDELWLAHEITRLGSQPIRYCQAFGSAGEAWQSLWSNPVLTNPI